MAAELFGWHEDKWETERIIKTMDRPLFALAATDELLADEPKSVWHWVAEQVLFGDTLPAHNQGIGDCVSQAWGRGVQDRFYLNMMETIMAGGHPEVRAYMVCTEATYALSRVEIGKRRLGRSDGSLGAWAAAATQKFGVIQRDNFASQGYDLRIYDPQRAKDWGWSGMPDNLEPIAKDYIVDQVSLITEGENARVALQNYYPIPICSNQGFTRTRERGTGICRPKGSWAHCMLARGFLILKGNRWVVPLQQSWGNDPTGPDEVELENGMTIKLPEGVFNVDLEVIHKMLRGWTDSFAIAGKGGFARRELPSHLFTGI